MMRKYFIFSIFIILFVLLLFCLCYPKDPIVALSYYPCIKFNILCPEINISGYVYDNDFYPIKHIFYDNYNNLLEKHSQLVIYYKDNLVVDLTGKACWFDCEKDNYSRDSIQNVFSTTKVVTSIVISMLVDRNILNYSDKIVKYWPTFTQNGKENITLQDVLQHSSGLAFFDDRNHETDDRLPLFDAYNRNYLDDIAKIIEKSYPHYPKINETKTAYHGLTRGLILNEIVRRVDIKKRTIGQFIQEEIVEQLNITYDLGIHNNKKLKHISEFPIIKHESDTIAWKLNIIFHIVWDYIFGNYLGISSTCVNDKPHNISRFINDDIIYGNIFNCTLIRSVNTIKYGNIFQITDLHNLNDSRYIESPSSNGLTNAWSMAKIMNSLLSTNKTLISKQTFKELLENNGIPEYDIAIHANVIYTKGGFAYFHEDFGYFNGFYGWSGLGGATMLLDPIDNIVVAFTTTRIETLSPWDDKRTQNILQTIRKIMNKKH